MPAESADSKVMGRETNPAKSGFVFIHVDRCNGEISIFIHVSS